MDTNKLHVRHQEVLPYMVKDSIGYLLQVTHNTQQLVCFNPKLKKGITVATIIFSDFSADTCISKINSVPNHFWLSILRLAYIGY